MTKQQAYQTLKNILASIDTKYKVHQEMQQMLDIVYSPEAKIVPIASEEKAEVK